MTDDPHDSTWIPPTKRINWCPIHQEDMELCHCGRSEHIDIAGVFVLIVICVIIAILSAVGLAYL